MSASSADGSLGRRLLVWFVLGALWLVTLVPPLLAWLWRDTPTGWVLPLWLVAHLGLAALMVLAGRGLVARLATRPWVFLAGVAALVATVAAVIVPTGAPSPAGPGKRVAVVGAGSAGVHAAWMLDRAGAEVTLYEAAPYVGGHAYSYPFVADDGSVHPVDMGFIFGSPTSYPEMRSLAELYGVGRVQTSLAMSATIDGETWATGMAEVDPELLRFHALAEAGYADESLNLVPFGWWLWWHGFDEDFRRRYLTPIMTVLFITDRGLYQVTTRFMLNMFAGPTRWLDYRINAPAWTVQGGSSAYYRAMTEALAGRIRLVTPVTSVTREPGGKVRVRAQGVGGAEESVYDAVVFGVHSDVALRLLTDATLIERFVLGQIRYEPSEVWVHTDARAFPEGELRRHYAYVDDGKMAGGFELHSMPVRSQGGLVPAVPEPILTLNPSRPYEGVRVRRTWRHHVMDLWHLAMTLEMLPHLQGAGNVWYAGDWVTFIGHGPAMASGASAACKIAGTVPRAGLPTEPCVDVTLLDPMPADGQPAKVQRMCGEPDVFKLIVAEACSGKGVP
jgi:predicted NAD/FAD-binding protein